jgi:hypothetical protein
MAFTDACRNEDVPRSHEAATPQPRREGGGAPCLERVAQKVRLVLLKGAEERGLIDTGAQRHAETLNPKYFILTARGPRAARVRAGIFIWPGEVNCGAHPQLHALPGQIKHGRRHSAARFQLALVRALRVNLIRNGCAKKHGHGAHGAGNRQTKHAQAPRPCACFSG